MLKIYKNVKRKDLKLQIVGGCEHVLRISRQMDGKKGLEMVYCKATMRK
jgi:hypothetical protein